MQIGKAWKVFTEALVVPVKIVAAVGAMGLIAAAIGNFAGWIHTHPAPVEAFLFTELAGIGVVVAWYAAVDLSKHRRVLAARAANLRALDSVGEYFPFRASEMPPEAPEIWFLLPARSDTFNPRLSFLIVPTCGKCDDHPALVHGLREGTKNALFCQRCGTVYSTSERPEQVTNDAGNALVRRLTRALNS